jgi:hypothetical protein
MTISKLPPPKVTASAKDLKTFLAEEDALLAVGWQTELGLLNRMMAWAFHEARDPRSPEYRAGVRDMLLFKLVEKPLRNPWMLGTAHADAWFAGVEEGKLVFKFHLTKGYPA